MGLVKDSLIAGGAMALVASAMQRKYERELESLYRTYADARGISKAEARRQLDELSAAEVRKQALQKAMAAKPPMQRALRWAFGVNEIRAAIYWRYIEHGMLLYGTTASQELRKLAREIGPRMRQRRSLWRRYRVMQRYRRIATLINNRASA